MSELVDALLADLATEGDGLREAVAALDAACWRRPTPAPGWDVATQVAHLTWTDEAAVAAATDPQAWDALVSDAIADPDGFVDAPALAVGRLAPEELLARWDAARTALSQTVRALPEGREIPWFGPPMSPASMATARFMETWAHALDVYTALGVEPTVTDRIRHVAHLGVRTRDFAFSVHRLETPAEPFLVQLTAPSGETWVWGPADSAQTVTGSAYDFCLLVTQRVHRADTDLVATGCDADRWLSIAQAFAGPAGEGRAPRG